MSSIIDSSNDESNNVFSALMKKPLTRKISSSTTSPNNINTDSYIETDLEEREKDKIKLSNHDDKENQNRNDPTIVPVMPCLPNAFTKLMTRNIISSDDATKNEKLDSSKFDMNDSLIDFAEESQNILRTKVSNTTPEILPTIETSTPSLIKSAEKNDKGGRRCSSRIQKNRELAEVKRIEMSNSFNEEVSSDQRPTTLKIHRKKSTATPQKERINKTAINSSTGGEAMDFESKEKAPIHNSNENINTLKNNKALKPAAIFCMGKKKCDRNNIQEIVEDPEKVAARKAFLLSSVPQVLRNQVDLNRHDSSLHKSTISFFSSIGHITQIGHDHRLFNINNNIKLPMRHNFINEENYFETNKQIAIHAKKSKWLLIDSKSCDKNLLGDKLGDTQKKTVSGRLNVHQIYNAVKSWKLNEHNNILSSLQYTAISSSKHGPNSNNKHQVFPVKKIFRRYLERKLEADTLESEARKKNISLSEIEEERLSSTRKLRRRVRGLNNENIKLKRSNKRQVKGAIKTDTNQENAKIAYDPNFCSSMVWTMKYSPKMIDDIIGNSYVVKKLHQWLGEWETRDLERKNKRRQCRDEVSDFSDYDSNSSDHSELSSSEEDELQNTAILGKYFPSVY